MVQVQVNDHSSGAGASQFVPESEEEQPLGVGDRHQVINQHGSRVCKVRVPDSTCSWEVVK